MRKLARVAAVLIVCFVGAPASARQHREPATWWQRSPVATTAFYSVRTDLPRQEAQAYGRHLDIMYREYQKRLSSYPARTPEKLRVFIFASQADYARTLKERFDVDSTGTSGLFFVNRFGSGLAFWIGARSEREIHGLIQHEAFHQFAYSRFEADLPVWVNEGLAEFFGNSVVVGERLKSGQATPATIARVRRAIETEAYVPFREMLTMSHEAWSERVASGRSAMLYDQAWSMIHFLAYGGGNRYQQPFETYLSRVNQRTPALAAFNDVFGSEVDPFEAEWKAYVLNTLEPTPLLTVLDRLEFLAHGTRVLSEQPRGEDAAMPATIAELRDALRAIGYERHIRSHGRVTVVTAGDDAMFDVPRGEEADADRRARRRRDDPPRFELTPDRRRRDPLPPSIRTVNFTPNDLEVRWLRDRRTRELRYVILDNARQGAR